MNHRHTAALAIAAAALCCATQAQTVQISHPRTITAVQTYTTYAVIAYTPAGDTNGCSGGSAGSRVAISWADAPDNKVMLANVLLAHNAGRPLGFGVSGCFTWSAGNDIPKVYRVDSY